MDTFYLQAVEEAFSTDIVVELPFALMLLRSAYASIKRW